jgi:hypothetical protein
MKKNKKNYWDFDYNYETMCAELKRLSNIYQEFDIDSAIEVFRELMGEEFNTAEPDPRLLNDCFRQIEYWEKFKKDCQVR